MVHPRALLRQHTARILPALIILEVQLRTSPRAHVIQQRIPNVVEAMVVPVDLSGDATTLEHLLEFGVLPLPPVLTHRVNAVMPENQFDWRSRLGELFGQPSV